MNNCSVLFGGSFGNSCRSSGEGGGTIGEGQGVAGWAEGGGGGGGGGALG
jgi:hypothetical protein